MGLGYKLVCNMLRRKEKNVTDFDLRRWMKEGAQSAKACGGGLYFRVRLNEACAWSFRYSKNGRARWVALGSYPTKTLAQARKDARRLRVEVDDGRDPAAEISRAKLEALNMQTISDLANEWFAHQVAPRIRHPEVVRRRIDNHILPVIGRVYLDELRAVHVDKVLKRARRKFPATASNCLRDLKKMFAYAIKREWLTHNIAANFDIHDAGGEPASRDRVLDAKELKAIFLQMRRSKSFGRTNELAVWLLLLLCVRKMELLAAKWIEFDLDSAVWHMPQPDSLPNDSVAPRWKKRALDIPLSPLAVDALRELQVLSCGSEFVFPARRITRQNRYPHVSPSTLNLALKQHLAGAVEHFTVHDLRRTSRTHLSKLGVSPDVAERTLNHKISGVRGVYDRHDYFDERRSALNIWARELDTLGSLEL